MNLLCVLDAPKVLTSFRKLVSKRYLEYMYFNVHSVYVKRKSRGGQFRMDSPGVTGNNERTT